MKRIIFYIVLLFVLAPLVAILYLSVVSAWAFPQLWDADFTLAHWRGLFASGNRLLESLLISLALSSALAVAATVFGFWMSKEILYYRRQSGWLQLAFYPYLIAPVILGAMLQYYFVRWGLTGTIPGVVLAQALFILPYSVLLLSTFWTDKVRQTAFQATNLGASSRQVNGKILLPMARPWLVLSLVQCFLISWFEYGITQFIGLGKVATLTIQAMHYIREANPHQAALAATLMVAPVLLLFIVSYYTVMRVKVFSERGSAAKY